MKKDNQTALNYIEFTSPELEKTQAFFTDAFGWEFVDYGDDYRDIQGMGMLGGIERGVLRPPLAVLQSEDSELEQMLEKVKAAGGKITQDIFSFPGGRRFQFTEPGGNEMAVWSQVE